MVEYDAIINDLRKEVDLQKSEINELKNSKKAGGDNRANPGTNKSKCGPPKLERLSQQNNYNGNKKYANQFGNNHWKQNNFSTSGHMFNKDGQRCYEEYRTVTEKIYYSDKKFPKKNSQMDHGGIVKEHISTFKSRDYLTPSVKTGQGRSHNSNHELESNQFKCRAQCSPEQLKMRQNQQPFIVEKAFKTRTCSACTKTIFRLTMLAKHREIEMYPHHLFGWSEPIYTRNMITQFYHMDAGCLRMRGFENAYLNLCYVEIDDKFSEGEKKYVQQCGFLRPVIDKQSKRLEEIKKLSISSHSIMEPEKLLDDQKLIIHNEHEEHEEHEELKEVQTDFSEDDSEESQSFEFC